MVVVTTDTHHKKVWDTRSEGIHSLVLGRSAARPSETKCHGLFRTDEYAYKNTIAYTIRRTMWYNISRDVTYNTAKPRTKGIR